MRQQTSLNVGAFSKTVWSTIRRKKAMGNRLLKKGIIEWEWGGEGQWGEMEDICNTIQNKDKLK